MPRRAPLEQDNPIEPVLELADVQGNILPGFNKDHQAFLFVRLRDVKVAKRWLAALEPWIATSAEVLEYARLRARIKARRGQAASGLTATWLNVAFSYAGLRKLTSAREADAFLDVSFRSGMVVAGGLGDPDDPNDPGHPSHWSIGGSDATTPDMLIILAADTAHDLEQAIAERRAEIVASAAGVELMIEPLSGHALRGSPANREHFGFRDGISQPGVRGRASTADGDFITERTLDGSLRESALFGKPGQRLVWPGEFLIGLPRQSDVDDLRPAAPSKPSPAWTKHGSYLVFRQLRQDVAGFHRALEAEVARLARLPGFSNLTVDRLGAQLIGRWRSGAPVMRTPKADLAKLADDPLANNDFNFREDTPHLPLASGRVPDYPQAHGDPDGEVCPFGSHLRKVNPRDDATEKGGPRDTLTRRILRRGIPYGEPLSGTRDDGRERGLLFVSYQASIQNQFQFLMSQWVTGKDKPRVGGGTDSILGDQSLGPCIVRGAQRQNEAVQLARFISPRAGAYFFAPSLRALREHLTV